MKLKITDHAQYRIRERKISIEDIKSVVRNPDFSKNSVDNRYIESRKKTENKILEVIYKKEGDVIIIITAYYL